MTRPALLPSDSVAIHAVLVSSRQAIDAVCDRWTLLIVLAMLGGERRFTGLMRRTGAASRLLTSRLRRLEANGTLTRVPAVEGSARRDYQLTPMGEDLADVIFQMARWEWNGRTTDGPLTHEPCGTALRATLCCLACGAPVTARDIGLELSETQLGLMPTKTASHRRSTLSNADGAGACPTLGASLDVFGDKWGIEILLCAFFRLRRFSDFRLCTGIAANILTDRLERFVAMGVLTRVDPARVHAGYRLTERGVDLYGVMVAVERWADAWLPRRYASPVRLIHRACGQTFRPLTRCSA